LDVTDTALHVRSWHWSWWVRDVEVTRESIEAIRVSRVLGSMTLTVGVKGPRAVKLVVSSKRLLDDLRQRDYPIT